MRVSEERREKSLSHWHLPNQTDYLCMHILHRPHLSEAGKRAIDSIVAESSALKSERTRFKYLITLLTICMDSGKLFNLTKMVSASLK